MNSFIHELGDLTFAVGLAGLFLALLYVPFRIAERRGMARQAADRQSLKAEDDAKAAEIAARRR